MSIIHKFKEKSEGFAWDGVESQELTEEGLKFVTKHVVIGENEGAQNYIMRYFRVEPGGHSRLERHPQEHEVIILHGRGQVQIAENTQQVNPFDIVFIEGNEMHQFRNVAEEPLGFICIIPK